MVLFEGTYNSRDVGGLPLIGGGVTMDGILIRSDDLADLTTAGVSQLAASDVGTIVDFRTPIERAQRPNRLPDTQTIHHHALPVTAGQQPTAPPTNPDGSLDMTQISKIVSQIPTVGQLYIEMINGSGAEFAKFIRYLASPQERPGLIVHCTAGKDRTGISTAMALTIADVEYDAIVENYHQSQANLAKGWTQIQNARLAAAGITNPPENVIDILEKSPKEAIEQALAYLDDQGGVAGYLVKHGATEAQLASVRSRLRGE